MLLRLKDETGRIVSSTDCVVTDDSTRDAREPGTCASAALDAGFEASLGDGNVRFLMLRGLAFADGPFDDAIFAGQQSQ